MALLPPVKFGVPNTEQLLPSLTPYDIALCFLIKGYLCPDNEDPGGAWPQRQALGDSLLSCIRQKDSAKQPSFVELKAHLAVSLSLSKTRQADSDSASARNLLLMQQQKHNLA